ncbi:MAG: CRISPR-associated endonuclease Cas1 [Candidatus Eremiobacterota bacterium]
MTEGRPETRPEECVSQPLQVEGPAVSPTREDPLALVARLSNFGRPRREPVPVVEEPVPARMLNEFVYCQRLAYLEWVQGEWYANADTTEGSFAHRRVDSRSGALPDRTDSDQDEDESGPRLKVRGLKLTAPEEGLVAVMDLVEAEGGEAVPIDFKRGKPPDTPERCWEPERVQVCAQALILRENGWRCSRGILYFTEARTRVEVPIDDELVRITREYVREARSVLARPSIPPPLVNSPKCPRCSLVECCLPDEVNFVAGRIEGKVRRLVPPRDDAMPLYVQEQGCSVGISGEVLEIREKGQKKGEVRLLDTSQVVLRGNAQISTQAIRALADRGVPILYQTYGGWFAAMTTGMCHKNVELRQHQFRVAFDPSRSLQLARQFVWGKIRNARTLAMRNARDLEPSVPEELKRLASVARKASSLDTLLGVEGMAARLYFAQIPSMLKRDLTGAQRYEFEGRNRRPPRDPVNALLSYLYSLMTKEFTVVAMSIGLDPYQGFYHQPRYGRPSLALDLMEEFRPLIADSTALTMVNNGIVDGDNFASSGGGVYLTSAGRRAAIQAYERRLDTPIQHPLFGYRLSYRRVLFVQVRLLARFLSGEIDHYPAFVTR